MRSFQLSASQPLIKFVPSLLFLQRNDGQIAALELWVGLKSAEIGDAMHAWTYRRIAVLALIIAVLKLARGTRYSSLYEMGMSRDSSL